MIRCTFVLIVLGIASAVMAQTVVQPGEVSGHWELAGSPYRITGDIEVPSYATLEIDPGVMVEFQDHFTLKVSGRLLAVGTPGDTILFTVADTTGFSDPDTSLGGWKGITIQVYGSLNDSTLLEYCSLEYGKAKGEGWPWCFGGALRIIDSDKVRVTRCRFAGNMATGPEEVIPAGGAIHCSNSDITMRSCIFEKNVALAGGAVHLQGSDVGFEHNIFRNNRCKLDGGAVSVAGGSEPSFMGDLIVGNLSGGLGGGLIFWGPCNITLKDLVVSGNIANWGGGIGFQGCEAEITGCSFSGNMATWLGGGIAADNSGVILRSSEFQGDSAGTAAGAIHSWQGNLQVRGCSFIGNSSWSAGAIHSDRGICTVMETIFRANLAETGGALRSVNSHLWVDSCQFMENMAFLVGGGIHCEAGELLFDSLFVTEISRSLFHENRSGRAAAGFTIQQSHGDYPVIRVKVDRCTISDNRARQVCGFRIMRCPDATVSNCIVSGNVSEAWTGGGTFNDGTKGVLYNSVFHGNHAATVYPGASSGGFGISNGSIAAIMNCTFSGNHAGVGGGLEVGRGGEATVVNSIFWENGPDQIGVGAVHDSLPCLLVLQYNLIQDGQDSLGITDSVSTILYGEGNISDDPLFVDEASGDLKLGNASPAIGAGVDSLESAGSWIYSPICDLEGLARPAPAGSRPDLGACENALAWPLAVKGYLPGKKDYPGLRVVPNPFRSSALISFRIDELSMVRIDVLNIRGQIVARPCHSWMQPGEHRVEWQSGRIPEGIYLIRITLSGETGGFCHEMVSALRVD